MNNIVSYAPHIREKESPKRMYIMLSVSLLPAIIAATILVGINSLFLALVCVFASLASEIVFNLIKYKKFVFDDYSTIFVGLLISMTMPPNTPLYFPLLGCIISNVLIKNCMGGVGKSLVSEVAFAKVLTFIAFSSIATRYLEIYAGVETSKTFLDSLIAGEATTASVLELLLGYGVGAFGEASVLFILIGGIAMSIFRLIDFKVSLIYIATVFVLSALFFGFGIAPYFLISGGVVFSAFYLLTDYSCVPKTGLGKAIYSVGAGLITVLYWKFGHSPNLGVFYAVIIVGLFANAIKGFYNPRKIRENK